MSPENALSTEDRPHAKQTVAFGNVLSCVGEVLEFLRDLVDTGSSWEIALKGLDRSGHVYISDGRVAWVRFDGHDEHLGDVLRREAGLASSDIQAVVDHCKLTGEGFRSGLVSTGLVSTDQLRTAMRHHAVAQLRALLAGEFELVGALRHTGDHYDAELTLDFEDLVEEVFDGPHAAAH